MSEKRPKCVICDAPADSPSELLCKKHWKSAQRQTTRLDADYRDLVDSGYVWIEKGS